MDYGIPPTNATAAKVDPPYKKPQGERHRGAGRPSSTEELVAAW